MPSFLYSSFLMLAAKGLLDLDFPSSPQIGENLAAPVHSSNSKKIVQIPYT